MMVTESHGTTSPTRSAVAPADDGRRSRTGRRLLVAPGERVVRAGYGTITSVLTATLVAQCVLTHREGRSLINTFSPRR